MTDTSYLARLQAAIAGKPKGATKKVSGIVYRYHVEVAPADVIALCDSIPPQLQGQKVKDLRAGSAAVIHDPRVETVILQADCLHHLLDLVSPTVTAATPAAPPPGHAPAPIAPAPVAPAPVAPAPAPAPAAPAEAPHA